jgi:hypothetical protein
MNLKYTPSNVISRACNDTIDSEYNVPLAFKEIDYSLRHDAAMATAGYKTDTSHISSHPLT